MTDEEKKAIEVLDFFEPDDLVECAMYRNALNVVKNLIEKQQKELEKKDKIINAIAEMLLKDHEWFYSEFDNYAAEDFIEYFEKKVEGSNE